MSVILGLFLKKKMSCLKENLAFFLVNFGKYHSKVFNFHYHTKNFLFCRNSWTNDYFSRQVKKFENVNYIVCWIPATLRQQSLPIWKQSFYLSCDVIAPLVSGTPNNEWTQDECSSLLLRTAHSGMQKEAKRESKERQKSVKRASKERHKSVKRASKERQRSAKRALGHRLKMR